MGISAVLIFVSLLVIYGAIKKPRLFWENYKVVRLRNAWGDNAAEKIHIVIGVVFIVAAIVRLFYI